MLVGQYSVLSSQSIVFLIDGSFTSWYIFFHKHKNQDFVSTIQPTQDYQDLPLWEQGIQ